MHFSKKFYKTGFVKNHKLIIIGSDLMQQFLQFEINLQKNYSSRENLIILRPKPNFKVINGDLRSLGV